MMAAQSKGLLNPPIFEDEDKNLSARLLNLILIGSMLANLAAVIWRWLSVRSIDPILMILVGLFLWFAFCYGWMKRGNVFAVGLLFSFAFWGILQVLAFLQGGLSSSVFPFLLLSIFLPGLILGGRFALLFWLLNTLASVGYYFVELRNLLPQPVLDSNAIQRLFVHLGALLLVALITRISLDHIQQTLKKVRRNEKTLADANRELQAIRTSLEIRVAERSAEMARRTRQLEAAAEIGKAVTSIRDLDLLLTQVTRLISERFGYYHAGIFLLDEAQKFAVLRAANSIGGQRMLDNGHKLAVGEKGIVGYVTGSRRPMIALDVGKNAVYFDNPDLPETRSEMALPLVVGGELLGALDVQSIQESAFSEEDIATLQLVADQISIAIDNARLFSETQAALEASRRAYRELNREAWSVILKEHPSLGYRIDDREIVRPADGNWSTDMMEAGHKRQTVQSNDETLAVPIKFQEQVTGVIRLIKPESEYWSAEEKDFVEALADQLYLALESARLYQETQSRAERERLAGEIIAKVRASNNPQVILQTAVQELRQALQAKQAQVPMQTSSGETPDQDTKMDGNGHK
jgi:GAF domain-containing protein